MRRVCVFCGSNPGNQPEYDTAARGLGRLIGQRGLGLVYGGGRVGLMGAVADAALDTGAEVIGVIPQALMRKEVAHANLTRLEVVDTMHQRKALMTDLADAFITLPGGIGTMEEVFEVWSWAQLGLHAKPLGFLDVAGYFHSLSAFLDHSVAEGFVRPAHRGMALVSSDPAQLLDQLALYHGQPLTPIISKHGLDSPPEPLYKPASRGDEP